MTECRRLKESVAKEESEEWLVRAWKSEGRGVARGVEDPLRAQVCTWDGEAVAHLVLRAVEKCLPTGVRRPSSATRHSTALNKSSEKVTAGAAGGVRSGTSSAAVPALLGLAALALGRFDDMLAYVRNANALYNALCASWPFSAAPLERPFFPALTPP